MQNALEETRKRLERYAKIYFIPGTCFCFEALLDKVK